MSDERIKQIRERLEAADRARDGLLGHSETYDAADSFIANAPADIAYLLERMKAAREAYGRGRDDEASGSPVVEYP